MKKQENNLRQSKELIELSVHVNDTTKLNLRLPADALVEDVKKEIFERIGEDPIPPENQRLIYLAKVLKNEQRLKEVKNILQNPVFHLSFSDPANASTTPSSGNARIQHVRKKMELCNTLIANGLECIKSSNLDAPASSRKRFSESMETGSDVQGTELPDLAEITESLGHAMVKCSSELHLMGNTLIESETTYVDSATGAPFERPTNLADDGKNLYQNNLDAAKYFSPCFKILCDFHVNLTQPPFTGERLSTVQLRREEL
ncbi:Oidioi.mRNA.OKI2018_I69.XSR.g14696.t1.cds [Oikopleura dioica]|uniref:Oidioi.mRNA.OKI2018_I69.XSR.g14696.t1.cds n=1 Tax=Oikopleura dioica TaxID=34765 RepID=A0ABN7SB24_OIKDI|nr:Oidioi.mRNA.OKI2018_I69.XSR.g14696.t1.cds [Oikopleura dioica]